MTSRAPAQAAQAGAPSAPASPHLAEASAKGVAARRAKAGVYDAKLHCGAASKRTGDKCLQRKGFRTDHPGAGHCWLHGGNTPNGRRHADRQAAENALAKLALPDVDDPIAALYEAVRVASWRELGLRQLLQQRASLFADDHLGDEREDVVSAMHDRALKRKAEIAKMAVDAGLDKRMVDLAESQANLVVQAVQAALDAAGISGEQRQLAELAAAQVLEPAMPTVPSGAELS